MGSLPIGCPFFSSSPYEILEMHIETKAKENNVLCCPIELFVVFLYIEAVCIDLIFSTLELILFLELHKKCNFFFVNMNYSG